MAGFSMDRRIRWVGLCFRPRWPGGARAGGAWALPVVRRVLYSEVDRIHAGGGRIRAWPVAPACFLWWRSYLGRILVGAACSGLLAVGSMSPASEAVGRATGCGWGRLLVGWAAGASTSTSLAPSFSPIIFLFLVAGQFGLLLAGFGWSGGGLSPSCSSRWRLWFGGQPLWFSVSRLRDGSEASSCGYAAARTLAARVVASLLAGTPAFGTGVFFHDCLLCGGHCWAAVVGCESSWRKLGR